ncbi:MAG: TIGR00269 family protein [Halobacteriales archaeon]
MKCTKCDQDAVIFTPYSGSHLCSTHFINSVERRVRHRIRTDGLITGSTEDSPSQWVIGVSGGKDSAVLTHILHNMLSKDPRIQLTALTINEGISGYRDESLEIAKKLTNSIGIDHEIFSYIDEFGLDMDEVVAKNPLNLNACSYCGVFRRNLLDMGANKLNADKLLTGHNLDDESQTALMNFLAGDVSRITKHFDASLAPFPQRTETEFVPRSKPLRDIPEKEIALYAYLRNIPFYNGDCPYAVDSFRGKVRELILGLEDDHPGTRHSIMSGYEEFATIASSHRRSYKESSLQHCIKCGSLTTQKICQKCVFVEAVKAV